MDDSQMLDWMHEHMIAYRHALSDCAPYVLVYFDDLDVSMVVNGTSLRDCIAKAYAAGTTRIVPL